MKKFFRKNYFLVLLVMIFTTVLCSYTTGNTNVTLLATNDIQIKDSYKKYLNFIPELALGNTLKYDYSKFKPIQTSQTLFDLQQGDSNTCAFAFDRTKYAYIGCNVSPARIVKYDMENMKEVSSIDLPSGENRDECRVAAMIALDSSTIIHASYTNPCVFTKIDGNTMKITGTLKGTVEDVNDKYIRSMTYDGKYVYAATDSTPGKIIVINPKTMQKIDEVVFYNYPINTISAITICNNYLVGVSADSNEINSAIFRIKLSNIHKAPEYITIPSHSQYRSICTDGKNIYAGTFTTPITVVKVNCSSTKMKFKSAFEGDKDSECGNFSIVYDGTDVIAGTWNLYLPGDKLIKLDPTTMKRKATMNLPASFPSDLMYLQPYIYTSCDHPTGQVIRVKF